MKQCKDKVLNKNKTTKNILVLKKKEKKTPEGNESEDQKLQDFKKYETTMKSAIKGLAKAIGKVSHLSL